MQWSDRDNPVFSASLYANPATETSSNSTLSQPQTITAGRAPVHVVECDGLRLIRKQYRRGGLVRHLSKERYVWTGYERTRAVREVRLLAELYASQLPVPRPIGCKVERNCNDVNDAFGLLHRAWLLTEEIPESQGLNNLLTASANSNTIMQPDWEYIGSELARFRRANIYHADLNVSNILFDKKRKLFLIDFDRGRKLSGSSERNNGLHQSMLSRLLRSIDKLEKNNADVVVSGKDREKLGSAFWS